MLTTPGGILLVLAVLLPVRRRARSDSCSAGAMRSAWRSLTLPAGPWLVAAGIAATSGAIGRPVVYLLGGWAPPLGIALRADGSVGGDDAGDRAWSSVASPSTRGPTSAAPPAPPEARAPLTFWLLLLAVWGSLNLVFVSGDLFTLYVALELLTFAGVPLVCLDGRGETLRAALRYLLFALAGSLLYLLGAVLLYGAYGTLDIALLAERVRPEPVAWAAAALMTVRAARQDRAVSAAHVAAAGACRGAGGRQRGAVGAGDQGLVVPGRAAVVRRDARAW